MSQLVHILEAGVIDDSNAALDSGTVKSFSAGTTTLSTLYKDEALTDPHPNPLTLSSVGRITAYTEVKIKLQIFKADGSLLRTVDNIDNRRGDLDTGDFSDDSITKEKLNSDTAGDGLTQATDGALDVNPDNTTLETNSDAVRIKDDGVSTDKIIDNAVTQPKIFIRVAGTAAGNYSRSASGVDATTTSITMVTTGLSRSLTTLGNPVSISFTGDQSGGAVYWGISWTGFIAGTAHFELRIAGTVTTEWELADLGDPTDSNVFRVPPPSIVVPVAAGTHTFELFFRANAFGPPTAEIKNNHLAIFEIK